MPTTAAPIASQPGKSSVKVDMVPSLFFMNACGASLQGQTPALAGVSPTSIVFADRPVRAARHLPTAALLEEWWPLPLPILTVEQLRGGREPGLI